MMKEPPVKIGDVIETEIIAAGNEKYPDRMISKYKDYIVFIDDCHKEVSSKVNVEIIAALPRFAFSKLKEE